MADKQLQKLEKRFPPGSRVTCRVKEEAYYSNYGSNPRMVFEPGMTGLLYGFAPKVAMPRKEAALPIGRDRNPYFAVVDYVDTAGVTQRVALHVCNLELVKSGQE